MKFRTLKINGFKGFADPVELPIKDGLSGIVGPNGCGKSNLVEAVGWVMGENRPSAMRGGAMEDVIFSGSATRPAGPLAEVQLVIDNAERSAPPGFNDDDELVIARRIERDLGSTFLSNGRDVRWRDLQLLFADSATGARSSALVNQGQTNDIINSKPSARKGILEEAAGVGGLHRRRHEAELKLSGTEQNLARASDVLEHLRVQIASLNRQARQARRYRKLGEQLRSAEAKLLYLIWRKADSEAAEADKHKTSRTAETARLQTAAVRAARMKEEKEERLDPLRRKSADSDAALQRMRAEAELNQSQELNARQALETLQQQIAEVSEGIRREQELHTDASGHIERLSQLRGTLTAEAAEFDAAHTQLSEQLQESIEGLAALEHEVDVANRRVAEVRSARESAESERGKARAALLQCEQRERTASMAVADAETRLAEAAISVKSADGRLSEAEEAAQTAESRLAEFETARSESLAKLTDMRNLLSETESRLGALKSEENELAKLVHDDASDSMRLLNHVRVAAGFETAFGAALGDDLFASANAGDDESGWRDIEPLENTPPLPEGAEPMAAHVRAPAALQRRISQIGLASPERLKELQSQLRPGQRIVTLEGDLIRWDGFAVSGREASKHAALRLRQLNRLEQLTAEIEAAAQQAASRRAEHDRIAGEFEKFDNADRDARSMRRTADEALAQASRRLSHAEADSSIAEKTLLSLKEARQRAESETQSAKNALSEAEHAIGSLKDSGGIQLVADGLKASVGMARDQMLELRSQKLALEREHTERFSKIEEIPLEIERWSERQQKAQRRIAGLSDRLRQHQDERPEIEALPGKLEERRKALTAEITSAEMRRREAAVVLHEAENEARTAAKEAAEAERESARSLELKGRADADAAYAAERLLDSAARISEKMGCGPDALAERLSLDPESLPEPGLQEIEVNRLRRSRDALGAVNLMAEKDIAELQSEMDELEREKADLEAAVGRLRRTISGLNKEGRERLLTAFETVNENFGELFTELFGGGKARLELVEGSDPLETGLEILCHPPGKRFSTISLLSGGEQTLTAVALIFAFFLANPAPVCVLDEVDAPLDDSNVMKFCSLLENIVRRTGTRFLIITHNPITMSRMDRLYGVTMQEKGVSRLVSVDLGEAERLAA